MWHGARVAVVVPAYNEERLVARMLGKLPGYVDLVVVVDDASLDATRRRVSELGDGRARLVAHSRNRGVGAAIVSGYRRALAEGADLLAVMAADDQMDGRDLEALLTPVCQGDADYAKGNRFRHVHRLAMPRLRRWAGKLLSVLTRWATALDVDDCQCGFTVLSAAAARRLPLDELWPRYGYPNDLLGMLAAGGLRVVDVPVRPVYAGEASGIRPYHVLVVALVILRRWWASRVASSATSPPRLVGPLAARRLAARGERLGRFRRERL